MADLAAFTRFARTYHPGEIIFAEYEPGDSFYLIQAGKVKITKIVGDNEKTLDITDAILKQMNITRPAKEKEVEAVVKPAPAKDAASPATPK